MVISEIRGDVVATVSVHGSVTVIVVVITFSPEVTVVTIVLKVYDFVGVASVLADCEVGTSGVPAVVYVET